MQNPFVLLALIAVSVFVGWAVSRVTRKVNRYAQTMLGFVMMVMFAYAFLFLYMFMGVVHAGVGSQGVVPVLDFMAFLHDAYPVVLIGLPLLLFGAWIFIRGVQQFPSTSFRWGLYSATVVIPFVYILFSMLVTSARISAFESVNVGDTETQVIEKMGSEPAYSSTHCSPQCLKTIWFNNPMGIDQSKWMLQIDQQGLVVKKFD
jgi:hypothetical protein